MSAETVTGPTWFDCETNEPIPVGSRCPSCEWKSEHSAPDEQVWAVFDSYEGEFVAAYETQRQAQTHADELEQANHDFTYTGSTNYQDRYSLDFVAALDIAPMEARA